MIFEQYRGDKRQFTVTVTTALDVAAKVFFAAKDLEDIDTVDALDANAVVKKTLTNANAVDNGDGTVTYTGTITAADIASVTPGTYRAEIAYQNGSGDQTTYPPFDYVIHPDINQRTA